MLEQEEKQYLKDCQAQSFYEILCKELRAKDIALLDMLLSAVMEGAKIGEVEPTKEQKKKAKEEIEQKYEQLELF